MKDFEPHAANTSCPITCKPGRRPSCITNTGPTWPTFLYAFRIIFSDVLIFVILLNYIVRRNRSILAQHGIHMIPGAVSEFVTKDTTPHYRASLLPTPPIHRTTWLSWWLLWTTPSWLNWTTFGTLSQKRHICATLSKNGFPTPTYNRDGPIRGNSFYAHPLQDSTCRGGQSPPPQNTQPPNYHRGQLISPVQSTILPYIEKQTSSHCQVHAINAYLGGPHVYTEEFFKFGERHQQILIATRSDLGVRPLHFT